MRPYWLFGSCIVILFILSGCSGSQPSDTTIVAQRTEPTKQEIAVDALTMVQIIQQGTPVECDIQTPDGQAHASVLGNNMRTEVQRPEGAAVAVMRDGKTYIGLPEKIKTQLQTDCAWLQAPEAQKGKAMNQAAPGTVDPDEIKNLPKHQYTCRKASFGKERFATPGRVCTLQELLPVNLGQFGGQ